MSYWTENGLPQQPYLDIGCYEMTSTPAEFPYSFRLQELRIANRGSANAHVQVYDRRDVPMVVVDAVLPPGGFISETVLNGRPMVNGAMWSSDQPGVHMWMLAIEVR